MKIRIIAIEDQVQGGHGWIIDAIDGKQRFEFSYDEYFTAQGTNPGRLLAHDVLEHACRIDQSNLDELAALGAIWANRDWDFTNGYGVDGFASEIGEQIKGFLRWNGIEEFEACTSRYDLLEAHYNARIAEIEDYVMNEMEYDYEENELENLDWDALHTCIKSYLCKGANEVMRKEARYNMDFNSRWNQLKEEIDDVLIDIDEEQACYADLKVYITFSYKHGVEKVTIRNQY